MMNKQRPLRSLDTQPDNPRLGSAPDESTDSPSPPPVSSALEPPINLVLVATLSRSASTPMAIINATWDAPPGVMGINKYSIQWSNNNLFPAPSTLQADTAFDSYRIDNLKPSTTGVWSVTVIYYVRVSAWEHNIQSKWSAIVAVTMPADTVAPDPPTTPITKLFLNNGDLRVTWVEPPLASNPNFRDVEIKIWKDNTKAVLLWTDYSATGEYTFSLNHNRQLNSGTPDPSLYVELRSRSWWEQYSTIVVVGTITKGVPGNPTGLTVVWDAARGALLFDWADVVDGLYYTLLLDAKTYIAYSSSFTYDAARNAQDHSGTPDPSITYMIKTVDAFGQPSTGLTATIVLPRPATPTGLASSWDGDTGIAGANCNVTWAIQAGVAGWILSIDGVQHDSGVANRFNYALDRNRADHSGTPDKTLSLSLVARDGLGQTSATSIASTVSNAGPPVPFVVLTRGTLSGLKAVVGGVMAADFWMYKYIFKRDGTPVLTLESPATEMYYEMLEGVDDGWHTWTVEVQQRDLFNQYSAAYVSASVSFEAITLNWIREQVMITDSLGSSQAALLELKDGITTSGGIIYPP